MVPLLLVLLLGVSDMGRAYHTYITIINAAREGARYGVSHAADTAGICARVVSEAQLSNVNLAGATCTVSQRRLGPSRARDRGDRLPRDPGEYPGKVHLPDQLQRGVSRALKECPMLARLRREHGQDLVEYAIILPILLLLLLGILEFAMIVFSYNTIGDAAREGARYGVIHPTDTAGIDTAARRLTTGLNPAWLTINRSLPGGNFVRVEVTYDAHLVTGLIAGVLGQPTMRLRAVATMQIE